MDCADDTVGTTLAAVWGLDFYFTFDKPQKQLNPSREYQTLPYTIANLPLFSRNNQ